MLFKAIRPAIALSNVVFPLPELLSIAVKLPAGISADTSSSMTLSESWEPTPRDERVFLAHSSGYPVQT